MGQENTYEGLPEIISRLMSSPEITKIIQNSGIGTSDRGDTPSSVEREQLSVPPDVMEKLPAVMAALQSSGVLKEQNTEAFAQKQPDMNEIMAKLPSVIGALSAMGSAPEPRKPSNEDKNRKALLSAIRPYMSDRKKGAIDTMLSMGSVAEIIKMLMGGDK